MPYALWFQKAGKEALNLVGGKNASLGELIRADIPVPPGFSVTTEAYQDLLIDGIKENENPFTIGLVDVASWKASQTIRELIRQTPMPENTGGYPFQLSALLCVGPDILWLCDERNRRDHPEQASLTARYLPWVRG
jgi:pyruvate,water dikinase